MGDPRPVLGLREGFLGEVTWALSRWMNRPMAEGRRGSEASGERVAKSRLRGEHGTLRCTRTAGAELEGETTARSVQEAGARKHGALWAWKGFLMLSYRDWEGIVGFMEVT